jgi:hypothetical protein
MKFSSIKNLILAGAILASLALFGLSYLMASHIFERVLTQNAQKGATTLSQLTFDKMYEIMSQGWNREQLSQFLQDTQLAYQRSDIELAIYRSQRVSALYGEFKQTISPQIASWIEPVFRNGEAAMHAEGDVRISLLPLKAEARCLHCHSNVQVGDVLGVMHIEQDLSSEIYEAKSQFFWFFLIL